MKRAITFRQYSNAKPFEAPDGIVTVNIDPQTGMPATSACPEHRAEVFIAGTEPSGVCPLHKGKGDQAIVSGWDVPTAAPETAKPSSEVPALNPSTPREVSRSNPPPAIPYRNPAADEPPVPPAKKKGFFGRLKDVLK